jgi:hypothetical protein
MDNKTSPSEIYIVVNLNNSRSEEEYIIKNETKNNLQWGEESNVTKLLHITKTNQHSTFEDPPIYMPKNDQHYYIYMPRSPTLIK